MRRQDFITAEGIIGIYQHLQYTAMAVGPHDLSGGLDLLTRSSASGSPWISANIMTPANSPLFAPWKIVESAGLRIGILGLTATTTDLPAGFSVADWQQVLPDALAQLNSGCDLIVLLSNMAHKKNLEIAKSFPQLHLLIGADKKIGNQPPVIINNTLITQSHTRGKYFASLIIDWPQLSIWENNKNIDLNTVQHLQTITSEQLAAFTVGADTTKSPAQPGQSERLQQLNQVLKATLEEDNTPAIGGKYTFSFTALSKKLRVSLPVAKRLATLRKEIAEVNKNAVSVTTNIQPEAEDIDSKMLVAGFVGSDSCRSCHEVQTAFWLKTSHANSLASLERNQQQYNLDCLGCHVTAAAYTKEKDHYLLQLPQRFLQVGCESCHGPAAEHAAKAEESPLESVVTEATCKSCHTTEMDAEFDYLAKLSAVRCPAD